MARRRDRQLKRLSELEKTHADIEKLLLPGETLDAFVERIVALNGDRTAEPESGQPTRSGANVADIPAQDRPHEAVMDDKDVERLEDRIAASEQRAELRLDNAMTRIDGKLELIASALTDLKSGQADLNSDSRQTNALIIGTGAAILLGVLGLMVGLKQVWMGGVQFGQSVPQIESANSIPAPPPAAIKR